VSNGQYNKTSRNLTDAKVKVPSGLPTAPRVEPEVQQTIERLASSKAEQTIRMLDKGRLVVRKETGWLLAGIIVVILGTGAYMAASFLTTQINVRRLQEGQVELRGQVETEKARSNSLERRIVELETRLDLMQGIDPDEEED